MLTSNLTFSSSCHRAYFPGKSLMFKKSKPFLGEDKTSENSSMIIFTTSNTRAALKVMHSILLCWPMTSEVDVGGTTVEAEPSHQYSIICWCCVTVRSGGAVWLNVAWCGRAYGAEGHNLIPPCGRNRCSSMLTEHLWRPHSGCEHSEVGGGAFQQQQQQVTSIGANLYEWSMQNLIHCGQKCIANSGGYFERVFCGWEFYLSELLCTFVAVSMEINRRHYFQNKYSLGF